MDSREFSVIRKELKKTQKQLAQLLGTSVKAVHSYEQSWRSIPPAVERHMLFLFAKIQDDMKGRKQCWRVKNCPPDTRRKCPAWEFKAGDLCWFINGAICKGGVHKDWHDKMKVCRSCEVLSSILDQTRHKSNCRS